MARKIYQFRYYANGSGQTNVTAGELTGGNLFAKYAPVVQLGIQSLPGTKFYLNGNSTNPIIIGSTGIYEIDVSNDAAITAMSFDSSSIKTINDSGTGYLIIDIIYGE